MTLKGVTILKKLKAVFLWSCIAVSAPINLFAQWDNLNMRPGVTDVSNEVFEPHMLIFYICCAITCSIFRNVLLHVSCTPKEKSRTSKIS